MRSSKTDGSKRSTTGSQKEIHISGAEGLYKKSDIHKAVKRYIERALNHPRGRADKIVITIEDIKQEPKSISTLPLTTISCITPIEGKNRAVLLLQSLGISKHSIDTAFALIRKGNMRGAALITADSNNRLEHDKKRGVRVTRLGINKPALKVLTSRLSRLDINTDTVREALILASKVASFRHVIAELCVSDDPFYTTGYVASKKFGYVRIPNIKRERSKRGGRAFFVEEGIDIEEITHYLERVPVIIGKVALCKGIMSVDEILDHPYL